MTSAAEKAADVVYRHIPRLGASEVEWGTCKLVAHRGCHDGGQTTHENTLAAFETACQAGVWGVELDVRWTRDQIPVVIHDSDTARLPGSASLEISSTEFDQLRDNCPLVPRLDEVVAEFGGRIHLMIELKNEAAGTEVQKSLVDCLDRLEPIGDFHIMSLDAARLKAMDGVPVEAKLLVAITNTKQMLRETLSGGIGGLTGHFLLLNGAMRKQLNASGIPWGTGFVNSTNLLAREIRSGASWVFSDAAQQITARLDRPA
ncbi:MAG: glycerophosphodiester phosphodiesterase [Acidiferrobacterales bacterium]|nr:glycerophosphodiester phosphodiesterase [Acidiferrobacterales bacterium]